MLPDVNTAVMLPDVNTAVMMWQCLFIAMSWRTTGWYLALHVLTDRCPLQFQCWRHCIHCAHCTNCTHCTHCTRCHISKRKLWREDCFIMFARNESDVRAGLYNVIRRVWSLFDVTPNISVLRCQVFEGNWCLHLQGKNVGRSRKRVRDKRKKARTVAKIEITGAVKIRIFSFNATTCPLWTSWSPLPVVAEV
jgi:hypothetical protein